MLYERAVLHSTAKSASAPTKRIEDASEHVAPSLSRLPYFYALVERLQALHEQSGRPPVPTPPHSTPSARAAAVTPTLTPTPTPKPAAGSGAGSADVLRTPAAAAQRLALVAELEAPR